MENLFGVSY